MLIMGLQNIKVLNCLIAKLVNIQQVHSDCVQTIRTNVDSGNMTAVYNDFRIRKFTPKECFRLMGVKDKDFEKIAKNQSNASLYHLAGDSIVVNVLMAIFKEML